jgi:transmembrane sensor
MWDRASLHDPDRPFPGKGRFRCHCIGAVEKWGAVVSFEAPDWDLLARYLAREAGMSERAQVERWAAADPGHAAFLATLEKAWAARRGTPVDVDAAWARLKARLNSEEPRITTVSAVLRRRTYRVPIALAWAAALMIAALVAVWRALAPAGPSEDRLAAGMSGRFATEPGHTQAVQLPDGSQVILGPATSLEFDPASFGRERLVHLEGVAFFQVRHYSLLPFVVKTTGTTLRDLGTAFEVQARPADSLVRVVVSEGAVQVRPEARPGVVVALKPRDVALLTVATGAVELLTDQDVDRILGWVRGELLFDDLPLREVALELERWYGVDCHLQDGALGELHYSGPFQLGSLELLDAGLQALDMALPGVKVRREGKLVWFTPEGRSRLGDK